MDAISKPDYLDQINQDCKLKSEQRLNA